MALTLPPSFSTAQSFNFFLPLSLHPSLPLPSQLSSMTLSNETQSSGLTRLLGVAFPGEKDKQEWESEQAEARRRDHRRIGTVSASCGGFVLFVLFAHSCQLAGRHCLKMSGVGPAPHRTSTKSIQSSRVLQPVTSAGREGILTPLSPWPFRAGAWHPKSQLKLRLSQCCPSVAAKPKCVTGSQQKKTCFLPRVSA